MTNILSSAQVASLIKAVGPTRTVIVEGEFGIGKTSIAEMFKNFVMNRGRFTGGVYKVSCQGLRMNESRRCV